MSPHDMSRAMSREGSVSSLRTMNKDADHRRCTSAPLLPLSCLLGGPGGGPGGGGSIPRSQSTLVIDSGAHGFTPSPPTSVKSVHRKGNIPPDYHLVIMIPNHATLILDPTLHPILVTITTPSPPLTTPSPPLTTPSPSITTSFLPSTNHPTPSLTTFSIPSTYHPSTNLPSTPLTTPPLTAPFHPSTNHPSLSLTTSFHPQARALASAVTARALSTSTPP